MIIGVAGVINASNVIINNNSSDLTLTETGQTQQLPELGAVTLSVAT